MTSRNERSLDIINPEQALQLKCTVVGCGAIGSQVAKQLAHMSVGKITLVDHDVVSMENMGSQGFRETDIGRTKVGAILSVCEEVNSQVVYEPHYKKFDRDIIVGNVVFCCVDSMSARRQIWNGSKQSKLFIDGRMNALSMRVITDEPFDGVEGGFNYAETIFPNNEMVQGSCTAKATIYTASIAAGLMVSQLVLWMNGSPLDHHFSLSLPALQLQSEQGNLSGKMPQQAEPVAQSPSEGIYQALVEDARSHLPESPVDSSPLDSTVSQ